MEWHQVTLKITGEKEEEVCYIFDKYASSGVCIENPKDVAEVLEDTSTWDYVDSSLLAVDINAPIKIMGYFETDDAAGLEKNLRKEIGKLNCGFFLQIEKMQEVDWSAEWKKFYKPIDAKVVTIVPRWMECESSLAKVYIEPGKAFGTGEHESTRMCLELLEGLEIKGKKVIDVGCGSGILGISAAILGAENVFCCDIDQEAVALAKENAEINHVRNITIKQGDLLSVCSEKADIVFANLTANLLKRLLPSVKEFLAEDGVLIVSGIIRERADEMDEFFASQGFFAQEKKDMGEWRAERLRR